MSKENNNKVRKSSLQRSIKRTLKTAEYESLVIEVGIEEEIEWQTLAERQKKIDNWNTLLLQDFKQSSDRIIEELGLTHKKAWFKNPSEETKQKFTAHAQSQMGSPNVVSDSSADRQLDLDDLDVLGD